jgi:hypothetical protein
MSIISKLGSVTGKVSQKQSNALLGALIGAVQRARINEANPSESNPSIGRGALTGAVTGLGADVGAGLGGAAGFVGGGTLGAALGGQGGVGPGAILGTLAGAGLGGYGGGRAAYNYAKYKEPAKDKKKVKKEAGVGRQAMIALLGNKGIGGAVGRGIGGTADAIGNLLSGRHGAVSKVKELAAKLKTMRNQNAGYWKTIKDVKSDMKSPEWNGLSQLRKDWNRGFLNDAMQERTHAAPVMENLRNTAIPNAKDMAWDAKNKAQGISMKTLGGMAGGAAGLGAGQSMSSLIDLLGMGGNKPQAQAPQPKLPAAAELGKKMV